MPCTNPTRPLITSAGAMAPAGVRRRQRRGSGQIGRPGQERRVPGQDHLDGRPGRPLRPRLQRGQSRADHLRRDQQDCHRDHRSGAAEQQPHSRREGEPRPRPAHRPLHGHARRRRLSDLLPGCETGDAGLHRHRQGRGQADRQHRDAAGCRHEGICALRRTACSMPWSSRWPGCRPTSTPAISPRPRPNTRWPARSTSASNPMSKASSCPASRLPTMPATSTISSTCVPPTSTPRSVGTASTPSSATYSGTARSPTRPRNWPPSCRRTSNGSSRWSKRHRIQARGSRQRRRRPARRGSAQ